MADEQHLNIFKQGSEVWNQWRKENPDIQPDLSNLNLYKADIRSVNLSKANISCANLSGAAITKSDLSEADLSGTNLWAAEFRDTNISRADLSNAKLTEALFENVNLSESVLTSADIDEAKFFCAIISKANLSGVKAVATHFDMVALPEANLSGATLISADLGMANLRNANMIKANLAGANLSRSDLSGANLSGANLINACLTQANLTEAILMDCRIFGISAWDLKLDRVKQSNLIISGYGEPVITVDNIEVGQFIYLLLNNKKIRHIIDTITSKVVLILGRFTPRQKVILDAIREELRHRDYTPVLFDFEKPSSRDLTETISTLAHMSRFIIADITDARSIPQELKSIIPNLPSVPVQPLLEGSSSEYGMFEHFKRYPWVLEIQCYNDQKLLLTPFINGIIDKIEAMINNQKRTD